MTYERRKTYRIQLAVFWSNLLTSLTCSQVGNMLSLTFNAPSETPQAHYESL